MSIITSPAAIMQAPVLMFIGMTLAFAVALAYVAVSNKRQH